MNETSHLPDDAGVYLLTHNVTGDTYVGSTKNIRVRVRAHLCSLHRGKSPCAGLQRVSTSHGADFSCRVLEFTADRNRFPAEERWVSKLRPTLNEATISKGKSRGFSPNDLVAVRLQPASLKRLQFMALADPSRRVEVLGGRLLAQVIDRLWDRFDPKRADAAAKAKRG